MTKEVFQHQINRMKQTWNEKNYPVERVQMFWRAFEKNTTDDQFIQAVDELIANNRAAPLYKELSDAIQQARNRVLETQVRGIGGFGSVLMEASRRNTQADREYVKACVKHFKDKIDGKLTTDQFNQGCDMLDTVANQLRGVR